MLRLLYVASVLDTLTDSVRIIGMMIYSHEIACDLRNAGWRDAGYRTRGPLAVMEFTRGARRKWILIDIATDIVVGGSY